MLLSLPGVVWVTHVAPHWEQELHSNLVAYSAHGDINDPSPASGRSRGFAKLINMQTILSMIHDDAHFYNPATYVMCGLPLLIWFLTTIRSRSSPLGPWLALAAIAALTLLPVYHRRSDAMLLLLTVPGCAMLWAQGGRLGRLALAFTGAALFVTGDIFWIVYLSVTSHLNGFSTGPAGKIEILVVPTILMAAGVFYLCVYVQQTYRARLTHRASWTTRLSYPLPGPRP